MSYQEERDDFIFMMSAEGLSLAIARQLLSSATTLHHLAVAYCNGDWPADNGERETDECKQCGAGYAKPSFRSLKRKAPKSATGFYRVCPCCYNKEKVLALLPAGFKAVFGGDPRGAVLKIMVPSGKTNTWGQDGIAVPVR